MDSFTALFVFIIFVGWMLARIIDQREAALRKEIDALNRRLSFVERETVLKDAFEPDEFCESLHQAWQRQQQGENK